MELYQRLNGCDPLGRHADIGSNDTEPATNLAGRVEKRGGDTDRVRRGALAAANGHAALANEFQIVLEAAPIRHWRASYRRRVGLGKRAANVRRLEPG
jgi:hypothetical protein